LGSWKSEDVLREKFEQQLAARHRQVVGAREIQPLPAKFTFDPKKGMGDIDVMSRAVTFWHDPEKNSIRSLNAYQPIQAGAISERVDCWHGTLKQSTGEMQRWLHFASGAGDQIGPVYSPRAG
jgi:hypothetical protein